MADALSADILEVLDAWAWGAPYDSDPALVVLAEATPFDRRTGAVATVRLSGVFRPGDESGARGEYRTKPTDTPASARYPGRLIDAYHVEASLVEGGGDGATIGNRTGLTRSAIRVAIPDNPVEWTEADAWITDTLAGQLSWDGATIVLKVGGADFAYASFEDLRPMEVNTWDATRSEIRFELRDRFERMREPIDLPTYAGTGGPEGEEDLKGQSKPLVFGPGSGAPRPVWGVPATLLGRIGGKLAYHVSVPPPGTTGGVTIDELREGGALLVEGDEDDYTLDNATSTLLMNNDPSKELTADVYGISASDEANRGRLIRVILADLGDWDASDIDTTRLTAFRSDAPAECGLYIAPGDAPPSYEDLLMQLMPPLGLLWVTRAGKLAASWLANPAAQTPDVTYDTEDIREIERLAVAPPVHRYEQRYARVHRVQGDEDMVGTAPDFFRKRQSREWRSAVRNRESIKDIWPYARDVQVDSPVLSQVSPGAESEVNEAFAIHARPRGLWRVRLARKWGRAWLGDYVEIAYAPKDADGTPRDVFGFDTSGTVETQTGGDLETQTGGALQLQGRTHKRFIVAGITEDLLKRNFELVLWG